jgi:RibD C-terminal domain
VGVALALVKGLLAIPLVRVLTRALAVAVATDEARFARSLVETGLIDEYRLVVHPVVLGAGERLFTAPLTIEPMSTTVFSGGGVAHVFAARP